MKINLTKILESPTRVIFIEEPDKNSTGYFHQPLSSKADPNSVYIFEIEKKRI